ncbi:LPS export ABC transporter periplasmic protein LptC [Alishewanella tabrizica]|uniref:Lipopolysaccharide export system protein LptC n=1 Tax=Alishewanella tabrizica TaxID=671278 RepID=A0ABQ2WSG2_9ALTE|nr:LPS export ABC transporter periplasmic protein LptC [Alishewanella tabrizica]GGW70043.1 hypothetical protein GCM10008111_27710 [Alishewanella tabrizica]
MRKFLVLSVCALVMFAAYLWFRPQDALTDIQADREFQPDYIAENVTLRIYDKDGYIADHVRASKLEHFEQLGFTQFAAPRYTLFNAEHMPAWEISSLHAVWFPEDKIILEQQVVLQNLLANELIKQIDTESLQLLLPEKKIQTHEAVAITGQGFSIKGIGLEARLADKHLLLNRHLETIYHNEQ